ncbi:MAG: futalosine hydrolase [Thermus sp.]|uniref:futalosine hydrolase n=1 Tax=Thermus sp. TaxID=275 RepID=UPI0025FE3D9A|nr:futalosine hydrolase [Thermus sp.]MCS7218056.1 futalosine hydrolase [Thermus sp.]MDW8017298.1 futalosine hydrolase [Thermus sp.]
MWLLLSPTALEAPFLQGEAFTFLGRKGLRGEGFVYLETGIGKVNAALTLAAWAARHPVEQALLFGLAGAYPHSGLALGEVVLVGEEVEADLGLREGLAPLGFPALEVGGVRYHNRFPLDPGLTQGLAQGLGLRVVVGLTRDLVSETPGEARSLAERWGAALENMEGAAFARVCLALGFPGAELRAISNPAGNRDKGAWRVREAVLALGETVGRILKRGPRGAPLA